MINRDVVEKFRMLAGSTEAVAEYIGITSKTYRTWVRNEKKRRIIEAMFERFAKEKGFAVLPDRQGVPE